MEAPLDCPLDELPDLCCCDLDEVVDPWCDSGQWACPGGYEMWYGDDCNGTCGTPCTLPCWDIPDVVEEVTEPEVVEPEIAEPEVVEPEIVEPDLVEPEVTDKHIVEVEVTFGNCDQFVYSMSVKISYSDGEVKMLDSTWCDESLFDNQIPEDLLSFIAEFLGIVAAADCQQ